jgi:pimeloyl-ACP methyl ester carboxylesterase
VGEKTPYEGYFKNGLPYNRSGSGSRDLIVFWGLMFENKPLPFLLANSYKFLRDRYTVYEVLRKPGMPVGYTLEDMADDYAALIREEFKPPLDIIGVSTGGSIAQVFAARHPDLIRKLVIHSSAYKLSDSARELQLRIARQGREGNWVGAYSWLMDGILPKQYPQRLLFQLVFPFVAWTMGRFNPPNSASDLTITVEAEDVFNFKDHLAEIKVPTLVAAGEDDPFYTEELFRETAAGIYDAKLALYPRMSHPAAGKQFQADVLAFLA